MPIDPSIPLQVQPNRLGEIFAQFQQQTRVNRLADQQSNRQNRLIQLKEDQSERAGIKRDNQKALKSAALFFETTAVPLAKNDDIQGLNAALDKQIEASSGDPVTVDGLEKMQQLLQQDPATFARTMDQTIEQARFEKLIPDPNKKSGGREFSRIVHLEVDGETRPFRHNVRETDPSKALTPIAVPGAEKVTSPKFDPNVIRRGAAAKAGGSVSGKERTAAKINLPKVRSDAVYLKELVQKTLTHPGMSGVVGAPGIGKAKQFVSGTREADFKALFDQVSGKQFSQAYETLKGGGQITEIEGEKATNALSRMRTSVSETEFKAAAEEFISEIDRLTGIAEQKASGVSPNNVLFDAADRIIGQ